MFSIFFQIQRYFKNIQQFTQNYRSTTTSLYSLQKLRSKCLQTHVQKLYMKYPQQYLLFKYQYQLIIYYLSRPSQLNNNQIRAKIEVFFFKKFPHPNFLLNILDETKAPNKITLLQIRLVKSILQYQYNTHNNSIIMVMQSCFKQSNFQPTLNTSCTFQYVNQTIENSSLSLFQNFRKKSIQSQMNVHRQITLAMLQ
eukprot:TRINITY_DN4455_c0_g2_i1.p1 TRINITY_DN4455_c0_g2~~TRINITY_DN4455_c0_g2_i1.p1  ORF type:complete len:197 (+),score=-29.87 TRINITY_DN4455_c0_g2_i1:366-956(+)